MQLKGFKEGIREAILKGSTTLPISSVTKTFDFDQLCHLLKAKQKLSLNMKTLPLVGRLLEVVEVVEEQLSKGQMITKRNLYYRLAKYYAGKYSLIDSDLELLCFNLDTTRECLKIFSSSKCLLFGTVSFSLDGHRLECSSGTVSNIPIAEEMTVVSTPCRRLVIVEKESAIYQLHQELTCLNIQARENETGYENEIKSILMREETIFLSAKGYPDSTSRSLVELLLPLVEEVYYLGDRDIYGIDILLCYSIGFQNWSTFLHRANWIQLQLLVDPREDVLLQSKEDKLKCIEVLQRPYLQDIELFLPSTSKQR